MLSHGISHWRDLLEAREVPGFSAKRLDTLRRQVEQWSRALDRRDACFFAGNLPHSEHWMLFEAFADSVLYLDIETTGLSPRRDDLTVVGLYDRRQFRALVNGRDLTASSLAAARSECRLLVTYFGSAFDVPFLEYAFPSVRWDMPHMDLCFAAKRVGLTGGLKSVERQLGIRRDPSLVEVDGYEAVRLWRRYQRGSHAALKKLMRYNGADTCNLADIAATVYARLCRGRREERRRPAPKAEEDR